MEQRIINPREEHIIPTSFPCLDPSKLKSLEEIFISGKANTLPPIELVQLPDGILATLDGNHRIAEALKYTF